MIKIISVRQRKKRMTNLLRKLAAVGDFNS